MHRPSSDQATARPFYSATDGVNDSGYAGWELSGSGLTSDMWVKVTGFSGGSLSLAAHQSASIPARAFANGTTNPLVYAYLTALTASASAQTFTVQVWNGKPDQVGSSELCTYGDGFSSVTHVISANANKITSISLSNSAPAIGATGGGYTTIYKFTVRDTTSGSTAVLPVQNIASGTQVKFTGSYPSTTSSISTPTITTTLIKTPVSIVSGVVTYQVDVSNSSTGSITLDSLQDTPTPASGWTLVAASTKLNGSTIADPSSDGTHLFFEGPFTVNGNSTITFTYKLHLTAPVSNSVIGTVGGQTLGATGGGTGNQVTVVPAAPIITTGALTDANVNNAYTMTLTASSGTPAYTWSIVSGSLPTGLARVARRLDQQRRLGDDVDERDARALRDRQRRRHCLSLCGGLGLLRGILEHRGFGRLVLDDRLLHALERRRGEDGLRAVQGRGRQHLHDCDGVHHA